MVISINLETWIEFQPNRYKKNSAVPSSVFLDIHLIWNSVNHIISSKMKPPSESIVPPLHIGGPALIHFHPSICAAVALRYGH